MTVRSPDAESIRPSGRVNAVVLDYGNVLYTWEPIAAVSGYVSPEAWDEFVADGGPCTANASQPH